MRTRRKYKQCWVCGVQLPAIRGRRRSGQHYKFCSYEHLQQHRRNYWDRWYRANVKAIRLVVPERSTAP